MKNVHVFFLPDSPKEFFLLLKRKWYEPKAHIWVLYPWVERQERKKESEGRTVNRCMLAKFHVRGTWTGWDQKCPGKEKRWTCLTREIKKLFTSCYCNNYTQTEPYKRLTGSELPKCALAWATEFPSQSL